MVRVRTALAPLLANSMAIALPIPLAAPVTIATLPLSGRGSIFESQEKRKQLENQQLAAVNISRLDQLMWLRHLKGEVKLATHAVLVPGSRQRLGKRNSHLRERERYQLHHGRHGMVWYRERYYAAAYP